MARPLRITFPGAFYHVTSRGNERKAIFKRKRDREKFLEYLETASERYQAVIHVFCLMDNHYHILLETPRGNLPQIMHHINGAYTMYFNTARTRSGHLFQGRYKAILVEKDAYAMELSRYIHLNPVRAKLVNTPEEYHWSSYRAYIGREKAPEWLERDFILGYFGKKVATAQEAHAEFVSSFSDRDCANPLKDVAGSVLLGSEEYIKFIKNNFLSGRKADKDLPALRQLIPRVSAAAIYDAVDYLCQRYTGEKLEKIGRQFGISASAVSHATRRARAEIEQNSKLKRKITTIEKKIQNS